MQLLSQDRVCACVGMCVCVFIVCMCVGEGRVVCVSGWVRRVVGVNSLASHTLHSKIRSWLLLSCFQLQNVFADDMRK